MVMFLLGFIVGVMATLLFGAVSLQMRHEREFKELDEQEARRRYWADERRKWGS